MRTKRAEQSLHQLNQHLALKSEIARMGSYEWYPQEDRAEWTGDMEQLFGITLVQNRFLDSEIGAVPSYN